MLLAALAAAAAQPQPGALKTFGDWTVGCDNTRRCQAVALVPDGEERERYLLLVIERDGAPAASPVLRYSTGSPVVQPVATLRVDGRPVGRATGAPLPFNRALAAALANGRRVSITAGDGPPLASASLAGLAAAFLYMDERQRRLGTTGALRRTGPKPDSAVPAPPPLPRVVQPRPGAKPPRTIAPVAAAELIGPENAICQGARGPVTPRAHRLDAGNSIVVVDHPCGNGVYNMWSSFFVVDESGRATSADFDAVGGMNPDRLKTNVMVNADWDPRGRRLASFAKGRGLGDCGTLQDYAWDGARFRLVEQAQMGECRGSLDYITTWRAAVTTAR